MNKSDARVILNELQQFSADRQLIVIEALKYDDLSGCNVFPVLTQAEHKAFTDIHDKTSTDPWRGNDDTFDEVIEAIETDMVGVCDCCGKYSALRNGEAAGSEVSACRWGCET